MRDLVGALRACLADTLPPQTDFRQREGTALSVANEAVRRLLEGDLQGLADDLPDEVRVEEVRYRRHQPGRVVYHSLCGSLSVLRWTYRRTDVRNGPTIIPLEHRAGLMHGATPALAYSVALGYAFGPLRHYEEAMEAAHRRVPSRSTLERLGKNLGSWMRNDIADIEPCVRAKEVLPADAHAVVAGIDRTTIPIAEPLENPAPKKKRKQPYVRRPPAPVEVKYRMGYVGTVSVVNRDGKSLSTRCYAATADEKADDILARMTLDVRTLRDQRPSMPLLVIQDGAPELWNLVREAFRAAEVGPWEGLIDRYHANQHLAAVLELLEPDPTRRQKTYERWQHKLDTSDGAMKRIAEAIQKRMYAGRRSPGTVARAHHGYLDGYAYAGGGRGMMCYANFRRRHLPVGSGVTEGACKSLIATRAKRSGQRWSNEGVSAALTLRALHHSDRLRPAWHLFERRYSLVMHWN